MTPKREREFDIATTAGDTFANTVVRQDLSDAAMWRPDFGGARIEVTADGIEGAYLPGADFRGVESGEFVPGVPVYMMSESCGAIVDDALVLDALEGDHAWLLLATEQTPETSDARLAVDFVVPFLQWSFASTQWERLLAEGYDPDELVMAAQEFPPRNEAGFKCFMDSGDALLAESLYPHAQAWGDRELKRPPASTVRRLQARAARSH